MCVTLNKLIFYNSSDLKVESILPTNTYNYKIKLSHKVVLFCLKTFFNIPNMKILKNRLGKPYIAHSSNLNFSISHTKDLSVFIFSDKNIGIDIEYVNMCTIDPKLKFFFNASEFKYIAESKNTNFSFYELWTLKEAYLKYLGVGLTKALKSIEVIPDGENYLVKDEGIPLNLYFKHIYYSHWNCIVSICSEEKLSSNYLIINKINI